MKRTLAAATLALLVGASPLVSAYAATAELKPYTIDMATDMRASSLIGERIYATLDDVEGRTLTLQELSAYDDIGEINDVILSSDGQVRAVVLGVGGFLGLGERDVTVEMSSLRFVNETDGADTYVVVNADKDQLMTLADHQKANLAAATAAAEGAVESTGEAAAKTGEAVVDTGEAVAETASEAGETVVTETAEAGETVVEKVEEGAAATGEALENAGEQTAEAVTETTVPVETTEADGMQVTTTETAEAAPAATPAPTETAEAAPVAAEAAPVEREVLVKPQVQTEGYTDVAATELTVDDLTGKRIYGADGEDIGEISDLVMGADGATVEQAVLDVGGFLGIGERKIAVPLDELQFLRNADGDVRIHIQATQQQLEAQPEYVAE